MKTHAQPAPAETATAALSNNWYAAAPYLMPVSNNPPDPITVMKWKETLDFLESATDRCEDAANVLEGVMVKGG